MSKISGTLGTDEGLAVLLLFDADLEVSCRPVSMRDFTPVCISVAFRAEMGGFRCCDLFKSPPDFEL